MDELEALLILTSLPGVGSVKIRLLMTHYGSAAEALKAPPHEFARFPGFTPKVLEGWDRGIRQEGWKNNLRLAEKFGTQIVPFTSPKYPRRLLEIADFPLLLYMQGTVLAEDQRSLAVVGTRQASIYGLEMARKLSRELAQAGITVVSGLARGIDTAAHEGALEGGRTIAVLGSGLASIYPKENSRLAASICQRGGVITEFAMAAPPDRQNFPLRNRIVSGMTMGTLVIEAPRKSGGMLTAERALNQGRLLFTLPGRADQENFGGNHALIKERKAQLVEDVNDILRLLADPSLPLTSVPPKPPLILHDQDEQALLRCLPNQELSVEEIAVRTRWPIAKLNVILMRLVLKKIIKEFPGKIYKKV